MDINVVASVVKQWFRELPEPLLTHFLYPSFVEAARKYYIHINQLIYHIKT